MPSVLAMLNFSLIDIPNHLFGILCQVCGVYWNSVFVSGDDVRYCISYCNIYAMHIYVSFIFKYILLSILASYVIYHCNGW